MNYKRKISKATEADSACSELTEHPKLLQNIQRKYKATEADSACSELTEQTKWLQMYQGNAKPPKQTLHIACSELTERMQSSNQNIKKKTKLKID